MSGQDSDEPGSYTEAVGTRLTPGTMERFEEYRDEIGAGNSEALRRLVRAGLDEQDGPPVPRYLAAAMLAVVVAVLLFGVIIATPYATLPPWLPLIALGLMGYATVAFTYWFVRTYLL